MSVRGIDGQIMVQRAPEAAKYHSDQAYRHIAFQKALAEQDRARAERDAASVPNAKNSGQIQLRSGQRQGRRRRKDSTPAMSFDEQKSGTKAAEDEDDRGVSIDIRV